MGAKERLLQYIENNGITKAEFYKKTGLSNGFLDKNTNINSDKLEIISSVYRDLNLIWLITGKEITPKVNKEDCVNVEIFKDEQNHEMIALQAEHGIPLIPEYAFAGFAPGDNSQIFELGCDKYVIPHFHGADGLISVKGSSMYPKYNSGDIVAFKKLSLDTFFQWNKVYILDTEQGILIKRIQPADDQEHILIVSDNPDYKPFTLALADIFSIAIVVGVIRLE